jgi:predicted RNA-binding Zn-ribbon protein involved in translation (DUF1610 family)
MGKPVAWADDYTLLCERCGYVVEGLATQGACPECGKPIAESLPERRLGTAWQRGGSSRRLLRTAVDSLLAPSRSLSVMRIDLDSSRSLARRSCGFALPFWGVLMLLTWIETRGLLVLGKRHGYRTTPAVAWTICAHGCAGWIVAAIGLWLGAALCASGFLLSLRHSSATEYDPTVASALIGLGLGFGGGLFVAGFLFFETFAWLGLRRLRYANRVRPLVPQAPGDAHDAD